MQRKQNIMMYRRIVDVCMTVLLLFLMAYQVTGEVLHEWIGMGMTLLVIIHQILNRRWAARHFISSDRHMRDVHERTRSAFLIRHFEGIFFQKDAPFHVALVLRADGTSPWPAYSRDHGEMEAR